MTIAGWTKSVSATRRRGPPSALLGECPPRAAPHRTRAISVALPRTARVARASIPSSLRGRCAGSAGSMPSINASLIRASRMQIATRTRRACPTALAICERACWQTVGPTRIARRLPAVLASRSGIDAVPTWVRRASIVPSNSRAFTLATVAKRTRTVRRCSTASSKLGAPIAPARASSLRFHQVALAKARPPCARLAPPPRRAREVPRSHPPPRRPAARSRSNRRARQPWRTRGRIGSERARQRAGLGRLTVPCSRFQRLHGSEIEAKRSRPTATRRSTRSLRDRSARASRWRRSVTHFSFASVTPGPDWPTGLMSNTSPLVTKKSLGLAGIAAFGACAACCALPFIAAAGIGGGVVSAVAGYIRPGADLLLAGGVGGAGLIFAADNLGSK